MAGRSNRTVPRGVVSSAGNEAFDACRNGNLALIKKLINTTNANLKDKSGRKSSPLHFAAGLSILLNLCVILRSMADVLLTVFCLFFFV